MSDNNHNLDKLEKFVHGNEFGSMSEHIADQISPEERFQMAVANFEALRNAVNPPPAPPTEDAQQQGISFHEELTDPHAGAPASPSVSSVEAPDDSFDEFEDLIDFPEDEDDEVGDDFIDPGTNQDIFANPMMQTPQQNAIQQNAMQQIALQQNALQQIALQQNVLQQIALQQNAPQQVVLQQNALQQIALQQNVLQQNGLQQNGLQQNGLQQNIPQQNIPQQNIPQQNVVSGIAPLIDEVLLNWHEMAADYFDNPPRPGDPQYGAYPAFLRQLANILAGIGPYDISHDISLMNHDLIPPQLHPTDTVLDRFESEIAHAMIATNQPVPAELQRHISRSVATWGYTYSLIRRLSVSPAQAMRELVVASAQRVDLPQIVLGDIRPPEPRTDGLAPTPMVLQLVPMDQAFVNNGNPPDAPGGPSTGGSTGSFGNGGASGNNSGHSGNNSGSSGNSSSSNGNSNVNTHSAQPNGSLNNLSGASASFGGNAFTNDSGASQPSVEYPFSFGPSANPGLTAPATTAPPANYDYGPFDFSSPVLPASAHSRVPPPVRQAASTAALTATAGPAVDPNFDLDQILARGFSDKARDSIRTAAHYGSLSAESIRAASNLFPNHRLTGAAEEQMKQSRLNWIKIFGPGCAYSSIKPILFIGRLWGFTYAQVHEAAQFPIQANSLRGKFREIAKAPGDRCRKPHWHNYDDDLLRYWWASNCPGSNPYTTKPPFKWSQVAEWMIENGASYKFSAMAVARRARMFFDQGSLF